MTERNATAGLIISILLACYGCTVNGPSSGNDVIHGNVLVHEKETPLKWSPDYSRNSKNIFRYYISEGIYYDIEKGLYFYREGDKWTAAVSIPAELSLNVRSFVTLEMDTDKPYQFNDLVQRKLRRDK